MAISLEMFLIMFLLHGMDDFSRMMSEIGQSKHAILLDTLEFICFNITTIKNGIEIFQKIIYNI